MREFDMTQYSGITRKDIYGVEHKMTIHCNDDGSISIPVLLENKYTWFNISAEVLEQSIDIIMKKKLGEASKTTDIDPYFGRTVDPTTGLFTKPSTPKDPSIVETVVAQTTSIPVVGIDLTYKDMFK